MFAGSARAITSRGAIALAGAATTGLALRSSYTHEAVAKEMYAKLLAEEAKVTELKLQLQGRETALRAALATLEATEADNAKDLTKKGELAIALGALTSIVSLVTFSAIVSGRGGGWGV